MILIATAFIVSKESLLKAMQLQSLDIITIYNDGSMVSIHINGHIDSVLFTGENHYTVSLNNGNIVRNITVI